MNHGFFFPDSSLQEKPRLALDRSIRESLPQRNTHFPEAKYTNSPSLRDTRRQRYLANIETKHTMKNQIQSELRKKRLVGKVRGAFSLVELLVVIAVIGIIAAIAIPNIGGITGQASAAKVQRNAQNVASVFSAARAAGNATSADDVAEAVDAVTTSPGLSGVGPFASSKFFVPLSATEIAAVKASANLSVLGAGATSTLVYTP
jgi:prepilin-type N-terminal cleavage/methylation domain-containing protein